MKKVLALTLSAVLAMGAATTAFAFEKTSYDLHLAEVDEEFDFNTVGLNAADDSDKAKMEWDTEYDFLITPDVGGTGVVPIVDAEGDIVGACNVGDQWKDFLSDETIADHVGGGVDADDLWTMGQPIGTAEDLFELIDAGKASLKVKSTYGKEYLETIKVEEQVDEMHLLITTADSLSTKDGEFGFELTLASRGSNSEFRDQTTKIKDIKVGQKIAKADELGDSMTIKEDGTIINTDDMEATEDFEFVWGDNEIARFIVDLDDNDG